MRFLMLVNADERTEAGILPTEQELSEMGAYNDELIKANMMLAGEGLQASSKGARVRISGNKTTVIDGPFAEAKELVAGFWLVQAKSLEEITEWAKRAPFREGRVEIRPLYEPSDFPLDTDVSTSATPVARKPGTQRYMVLLKADKLTENGAPANEKLLSEMGALIEEVQRAGDLLAGDGLKPTSQGLRIVYAGDKRSVVDGPFSESKEIVAGYSIIQATSLKDATEFARRMLQIHVDFTGLDGEIEVRQVFELEDFPVNPCEQAGGWRDQERAFREATGQ